MAVDDNSPKTGEPQAPSGGDSSTAEMNDLVGTADKMQVGAAVGTPLSAAQRGGGGGGGRRKQCRPMRLVCSLIDTVDPQSEDDTAAVPGPPSMTADYPDAADFYVQSSSPPPPPRQDGVTDLVVRRRHQQPQQHHVCDTCGHTAASDAELTTHYRVSHGRKSSAVDRRLHGGDSVTNRRLNNLDDNVAEIVDGEDLTTNRDDDDENADEVEFPTRYHRLGSELKREVETADSRLEQIHADAVRRSKISGGDQQHHRQPNEFQQSAADFDGDAAAYAYASQSSQQQYFRSRHQLADGLSAADNTYGTALDFTVQSRSNAGNGGNGYDISTSGRQQQQHHGLSQMSSATDTTLFPSDSSGTTGSEQLHQQSSTAAVTSHPVSSQHGHHHHHHHHQAQQQQQQSHHRSTYSSSIEPPVSAVTMSGSSVGPPPQVAAPPAPAVQVDSEDYCDRCQKHFCNKYYLRKHRQDVHGIAPSTDTSSSANSSSNAGAASSSQQQHISNSFPPVTGSAAAAAAVQQLLQQQSGGDNSSPVTCTTSGHASVLPYQQLINSLPFVLPYQQSVGLPGTAGSTAAGNVMSSGSLFFQPPSTAISSSPCGLQSVVDAAAGGGTGQAMSAGGGLLPGLTSLMLLNPFAILNAPSFLQSQAAVAAGLAAAAGMNLAASSSLNTLAEMQKTGGAAGGATLFSGGIDDASLSMAGLLPPFVGGPTDQQSSLLSSPPSGQPPNLSGANPDDFSSSPSSTGSSSASFICDLCRKEFCSSYFLAVHRRDKHGIQSAAAGDLSLTSSALPPSSSSSGSASSPAAAAAAAMAAAAGLRLPSTALSDAIRLLAASNGRSALDAAFGVGSMMADGAEPGEKISSSTASRSSGGKLQPSNDLLSTSSSSSSSAGGGRTSGPGAGAALERLGGQLLGGSAGGLMSSGPEEVCCLCKKQFPNRYGLVLHLLSAHSVRPEGFGLAGELLQLDGLLSAGGIGGLQAAVGGGPGVAAGAGNVSAAGRSSSRSSAGNAGSLPGLTSSTVGGSQSGSGSSSTKQSDRVSCDICNKEVCNKYFLKTHKIKVHGVDSSVAASYVPPQPPQQQQQEASGRSEMQTVSPPADSKSGRGSGQQSLGMSLKHEDMRKGLMLADSQLNSFAAHLDLALKKDSFGLAGLGLTGLGLGPPGSGADRDHQPTLPPPPPSMSASDLFRLFSAVGGAGGKPDDPFGLSAAFGLAPAIKSLCLPELTDQLAATMAAAAAAASGGLDGRSRSASSTLSELNIPKHPSSSSSVGGGSMTSSYYKDANMVGGPSSNHGGLKSKMPVSGLGSSGKHAKEHHHLKSSSSSSSLNAVASSGSVTSSQSASGQLSSSAIDRQQLTEQDLIQSGIDPEAYCELCQKEFCSKYFLRTHRQKIHGVVSGAGGKSSSSGGGGSSVDSSSAAGGSGMVVGGGAFEHYRSLASNPAAGLPALAAGAAMPLLPLFQGLSLPPVPFCTGPPGVGPQLMLPPDAAGLLGSADGIGGHGGMPTGMPPATTRPSGTREAANATRVTCEVCGKELCNKYFLKTHMMKIHGTHPSSTSAQSSSSSSASSASSAVRDANRDHVQQQQQQSQQHSTSGSSSSAADSIAHQQVDGSDGRILTPNSTSDSTSSRLQQPSSTVPPSAANHDVDLLAPSAFQSLVNSAPGSRGSPPTPTAAVPGATRADVGSFATPGVFRAAATEGGADLESDLNLRRFDLASSASLGRLQKQQEALDAHPRRVQPDAQVSMPSSRKSESASPVAMETVTSEGSAPTSDTKRSSRQYNSATSGSKNAGYDDGVCSEDDDDDGLGGESRDDDVAAGHWRSGTNGSMDCDGDRRSGLGQSAASTPTKRKLVVDEYADQLHKKKKTDEVGDSDHSESSSLADSFRIGQQQQQPTIASSPLMSSESGENGLLSPRGLGPSMEFLQHQLLLSKLASELQSRSFADVVGTGTAKNIGASDGDEADESKVPVTALLHRHLQQQQLLQQFPAFRGIPSSALDQQMTSATDDVSSSDGGRSRRARGTDDGAPRMAPVNGHSSANGAGVASMNEARRLSPSSAAVDSNGSGLEMGSGSGGSVGVPSPPCRLFLPPVVSRSGRDQVGIDFSVAASGRTTTPQQAD